jgi:hypothetical protein
VRGWLQDRPHRDPYVVGEQGGNDPDPSPEQSREDDTDAEAQAAANIRTPYGLGTVQGRL